MRILLFICAAVLGGCSTYSAPTLLMATQIGAPALDEVDGQPGNPFATAFIEALRDPHLKLSEVGPKLILRTTEISGGFQTPEIMRAGGLAPTTLSAAGPALRRVALVIVHSQYEGWPALMGAAFDAKRVGEALTAAGYRTTVVIDPSRSERARVLDEFAGKSVQSDVAILYSTGHGVMWGEDSFLLDSDYQKGWREDELAHHAIKVSDLGKALKAKGANLLLFGGCRDYVW